MSERQDQINELQLKLSRLEQKHRTFAKEILELKVQILELKTADFQTTEKQDSGKEVPLKTLDQTKSNPLHVDTTEALSLRKEVSRAKTKAEKAQGWVMPEMKSDVEKFIGQNLINKIGIVITIIGAAIGAKYAVDHQMVSPVLRIISGYLLSFALLGAGLFLRKKYLNFSAVLVSGAMAIGYYITYAAYSYYEFLPQALTFVLMLIITVATAWAAISFNRQVIAHIGLIGAYSIPFLLSDGSGNVLILFSYIGIINAGILAISLVKSWKSLLYHALPVTWLIFAGWYVFSFNSGDFAAGLAFSGLFFLIFYAAMLAEKFIHQKPFAGDDITLLLANSFLFFGLTLIMLQQHSTFDVFTGLFTMINAAIHGGVAWMIRIRKKEDLNLMYLVTGLAVLFFTLAVPIQLDGQAVTMVWTAEAVLLFWFGRKRNISLSEYFAYPLMFLASASLLHDWSAFDHGAASFTPLMNREFLTSAVFVAGFAILSIINLKTEKRALLGSESLPGIFIGSILITGIYLTFLLQITWFYNFRFDASGAQMFENGMKNFHFNYSIRSFQYIWLINYSLFFAAGLALINSWKIRDRVLEWASLFLNSAAILVFLVIGLYELSELREYFIHGMPYFETDASFILIRYLSLAIAGFSMFAIFRISKSDVFSEGLKRIYGFLFHVVVLWIASSELISLMDLAGAKSTYKLGLSILWGSYAVLLIVLGIWKRRKHLRISAMGLLAVTLLKLFFYDIAHFSTLSKTVVLLALGILMLIISFLYNRYRNNIFGDAEEKQILPADAGIDEESAAKQPLV